jgi:hypothetical protein
MIINNLFNLTNSKTDCTSDAKRLLQHLLHVCSGQHSNRVFRPNTEQTIYYSIHPKPLFKH